VRGDAERSGGVQNEEKSATMGELAAAHVHTRGPESDAGGAHKSCDRGDQQRGAGHQDGSFGRKIDVESRA
jgi:hypothetical protein